jgi:hypothetical protein
MVHGLETYFKGCINGYLDLLARTDERHVMGAANFGRQILTLVACQAAWVFDSW